MYTVYPLNGIIDVGIKKFTQALPAPRDPPLAGFFMPVFCG